MDFVIIGIIAVLLGLAIGYIVKAKKSGRKCIGCPDSSSCSGHCSSCSSGCSCCSDDKDKPKSEK